MSRPQGRLPQLKTGWKVLDNWAKEVREWLWSPIQTQIESETGENSHIVKLKLGTPIRIVVCVDNGDDTYTTQTIEVMGRMVAEE